MSEDLPPSNRTRYSKIVAVTAAGYLAYIFIASLLPTDNIFLLPNILSFAVYRAWSQSVPAYIISTIIMGVILGLILVGIIHIRESRRKTNPDKPD